RLIMKQSILEFFKFFTKKPTENNQPTDKPSSKSTQAQQQAYVQIEKKQLIQNLGRHAPECDIFDCMNPKCAGEIEPDRIISKPYVVYQINWPQITKQLELYIRDNPQLASDYKSGRNMQKTMNKCMKFIMPVVKDEQYKE